MINTGIVVDRFNAARRSTDPEASFEYPGFGLMTVGSIEVSFGRDGDQFYANTLASDGAHVDVAVPEPVSGRAPYEDAVKYLQAVVDAVRTHQAA